MGVATLKKVQYGLETTHGDNVAADTMLLLEVSLPESDREVVIPEVNMGVRTNRLLDSAFVRRVLADGIVLETPAAGLYFEALPLIFSMGILASTGTEVTTGQADYQWMFAAPQTATETIATITLEVGDDQQGYEIGYCLAKQITISGDCDSGEVNCSVEVVGEQVEQTTVTPDLSIPTAEFMSAKLSQIYIDDTWAGLGGNELTAALVNWEVVIVTGVHAKLFGSSGQLFGSHGQDAILARATFTFERNAAVKAEELKYRPASGYATTTRHVRLTVTGTQIGTGTNQSLQIDMAGVWGQWHSLGADREGNTLDVCVLEGGYDDTGGQGLSVTVTTTIDGI